MGVLGFFRVGGDGVGRMERLVGVRRIGIY